MRFLVDESTGLAVVAFLRREGHDVIAVSEAMPQADDDAILDMARTEERIVVTNEKDFGDLVYRSGRVHSGVLLLRLRDESSAGRVRMVAAVLREHAGRLSGAFVAASEGGVRVRVKRKSPQ